jgi:flagellar basal body-associated protein FliL
MAEETRDDAPAGSEKKSGILPLIVVAIAALSGGIATPIIIKSVAIGADATNSTTEKALPDKNDKPTFILFGAVTVNLDSDRLNRFLHVDIALQVRESKKLEIEKQLEAHRQILNNWLISFLADQNLEEIRGANGHNRLRREIRDQFNTMLFRSGGENIEDVLFQEFNVQ